MRLMLSVPPATATSENPVIMCSLAVAIACRPDEQKRLTVCPATVSGRPARRAASRAAIRPCFASRRAQPITTSSMSAGSSPPTRATASLITAAAISSGRVSFRVPRGALPTAVRTALTMTASFIGRTSGQSVSISQWPPRLQQMPHPVLRLALPDQVQERFPFQVVQVLLRDARPVGHPPAANHVGEPPSDSLIVLRDVPGGAHQVQVRLQGAQPALADDGNHLTEGRPVSQAHQAQRGLLGIVDQPVPVHGDAAGLAQISQRPRVV